MSALNDVYADEAGDVSLDEFMDCHEAFFRRHGDEAVSLVEFLHRQSAFLLLHGGAALKHEAEAMANAASLLDSYRAGLVVARPHPLTGVELIRWTPVSTSLPAADTTALLRIVGPTETYVWVGHYDGEQWMTAEGSPLGASAVTDWADFPCGPVKPEAV